MASARIAAILAVTLLAPPAGADLLPDSGVEAGGRIGYGAAFGETTGDAGGDDLRESIRGMMPLWLDVGYRVVPELMFGVWLQTGFGFLGDQAVDSCDAGNLDCTVFDLRLGVQGQYHFRPVERMDPWVGLGFGYEWLTLSRKGSDGDSTLTYRGFEFLNFQAGLDFLPRKGVGVGPFASFSIGQYDTVISTTPIEDTKVDVEERRLHHWLVFGVRGTFVL
jgi:hypothetical protein